MPPRGKSQFSLWLEPWILEKIRQRSKNQNISQTEFIERAILAELGLSEEDREATYRVENWKDKDRIEKLEKEIKELKANHDRIERNLEARIDSLWDSLQYVSEIVDHSAFTRTSKIDSTEQIDKKD